MASLTNKDIAELLFTPAGEGKARCVVCKNAYAIGSGYTNRLIHAKRHEEYEAVANEILTSNAESTSGEGAQVGPVLAEAQAKAAAKAEAQAEAQAEALAKSQATQSEATGGDGEPKKRGRPAGSKNKSAVVDGDSDVTPSPHDPTQPRRRGRPPGAKTKPKTLSDVPTEPKKRGRPPGSSNKPLEQPRSPKMAKRIHGPVGEGSSDLGGLRKEMQEFQASVRASVQTMQANVQALQDTVQCIRGNVDELRNNDRRAKNRRIAERAVIDPRFYDAPLHRFIRVTPEFGGGISGGQYFRPPPIALGEEIPSPPFPATLAQLDDMPRQQIHELAVMMDTDFDIIPGDNLAVCRAKVHRVLTDEL